MGAMGYSRRWEHTSEDPILNMHRSDELFAKMGNLLVEIHSWRCIGLMSCSWRWGKPTSEDALLNLHRGEELFAKREQLLVETPY